MEEDKEREALRRRLLHEERKLQEGHDYVNKVLGSGDSSPGKRRMNDGGNNDEALESPTKRSKFVHGNGAVNMSDAMEGVENDL